MKDETGKMEQNFTKSVTDLPVQLPINSTIVTPVENINISISTN